MTKYILSKWAEDWEAAYYSKQELIDALRYEYCEDCSDITSLDNTLQDVLDCPCGHNFIIELEEQW